MPTIDTDELSARDLVLTLHPIMGPHDHYSTGRLADEMDEYMRTLVHIVQPERADRSLPWPATIDRIVASFESLLHRGVELMTLLDNRLDALETNPRVYEDARRGGDDVARRCQAAYLAFDEARMHLVAAANAIRDVHRETSHLGYDDPAEVEA